jgi:hypothetical protein
MKLILKEFKNNFKYFLKELNMLKGELKDLEKNLSDYLLWNISYDNYDKYECIENKLNQYIKEYKRHIKKVGEIIIIDLKGESAKLFIKEFLDFNTTEELLNINPQPKNTCPFIDEAIKEDPSQKNILEVLRTSCEDNRDIINNWKKDIWNNVSLNLSSEGIVLSFGEVNPDLKCDKLSNKELSKLDNNLLAKNAIDNYNKILEWGINYNKKIRETNLNLEFEI